MKNLRHEKSGRLSQAAQHRGNTQEHVQQAIADLQTLTDLVAKLLDLQAIKGQ
jgi:hypothetical protein